MSQEALLFFSLSPFFIFIFLLLFIKTTLLKSSVGFFLTVLFLSLGIWKISNLVVITSFSHGAKTALDIFLIIFGAIFFLDFLEGKNIVKSVAFHLESLSLDIRIRVILLAWFFEGILEGTVGFGTPGAVVVPLLVGLGISPIKAVAIALLGNSTPGTFGALGTPIKVGLAGFPTEEIARYSSIYNFSGIIVPTLILVVLASGSLKNRFYFVLERLPFSIFSGVLFCAVSYLSIPLGVEFPSVVASLVGIIFMTVVLKTAFPKVKSWPAPEYILGWKKSIFPYFLLVMLLFFGKILKISLSPGVYFIIATFIVAIFYSNSFTALKANITPALKSSYHSFFVIFFMAFSVELIKNSHLNNFNIPSFVSLISTLLETKYLTFIAPFIGAFGAFITGSVTLSGLLFSDFLHKASNLLFLDSSKILALLVSGATAGNTIALADIMAGLSVVRLRNKERDVLKIVILPTLFYLVVLSLLGGFSV